MGRIFRSDASVLVKFDSTHAELLSGACVTIGGQQFITQSNLMIDTAITGSGGLDTGTVAAFKLYYVHLVRVAGVLSLVASLNKINPVGFASYGWTGWIFFTNDASVVGITANTTTWPGMPYAPVGAWVTNTSYTGLLTRKGDVGGFYVRIDTANTPGGGLTLTVDMPTGLVIDIPKLPLFSATVDLLPASGGRRQDGPTVIPLYVDYYNSTSVFIAYLNGGALAALTSSAPSNFSVSNTWLYWEVPVVGWDANAL